MNRAGDVCILSHPRALHWTLHARSAEPLNSRTSLRAARLERRNQFWGRVIRRSGLFRTTRPSASKESHQFAERSSSPALISVVHPRRLSPLVASRSSTFWMEPNSAVASRFVVAAVEVVLPSEGTSDSKNSSWARTALSGIDPKELTAARARRILTAPTNPLL